MNWESVAKYIQLALIVAPGVEASFQNAPGATKATVALHAIQGLSAIGGAIAPPGQAQDILAAISIAVAAINAAGLFTHKAEPTPDPVPAEPAVAPV